jgi:hypothetical protein
MSLTRTQRHLPPLHESPEHFVSQLSVVVFRHHALQVLDDSDFDKIDGHARDNRDILQLLRAAPSLSALKSANCSTGFKARPPVAHA